MHQPGCAKTTLNNALPVVVVVGGEAGTPARWSLRYLTGSWTLGERACVESYVDRLKALRNRLHHCTAALKWKAAR